MNGQTKFVSFYIGNRKYYFLVDTGASLSVIQSDTIPRNTIIHSDDTLINGIGGQIKSPGYVCLKLIHHALNHKLSRTDFDHHFYVFNNVPLKADGILGLDFLSKYGSNINLDTNVITLYKEGMECCVPLSNEIDYTCNTLVIPARSESIHYLFTDSESKHDSVILAKQLTDEVFLAGSIVKVKNNKIPVKILNTSEQDVMLPAFQPQLYPLHQYDICEFNQCTKNTERVNKLLNSLQLNNLNTEEQSSIEQICSKYADVFFLSGDQLTTTNIYEQTITLKANTSPVYVKQYRLPQALKKQVDVQIQKLIDNDIIEEAKSEWSSPILLIPKKNSVTQDNKWRLVVDYRKLNDCIVDDKFPLPNITEILDSLSGSIYFSHLDLYQGYYQVILDKQSRNCTAFTTNSGQYQMKRLPMGLKTSPSAFSRVMSVALSGLTFEQCFVYLDDLIVFGRSLDIHNKHLINVLERLRKVNLKLNPEKCKFLQKEILYLGHLVTADGVLPDSSKIEVLQKYPEPKNSDEVKRFVAFCNYYRKFICNFAEMTAPLNYLTRKHVPFVWSTECKNSFEALKKALMTPPVLQFPDFSDNNEFVIQTDASGVAVGAVLCNKNMKPVAYASRPLNKAERNYPTIQKELVAIVWAVKYFRPYIYGRQFSIMTDHKPLLYLFSMKDPSSRLLKFRLALEEFNFKILYIKGKDNSVADALSRICITSDTLKTMNEEVVNVLTRAQRRCMNDKPDLETCSKSTDIRSDQPNVVELLKMHKDLVELTFIGNDELTRVKTLNKVYLEDKCFIFDKTKRVIYINLNWKAHFTRAEFVTELMIFCKRIQVNDELCIVISERNKLFIKGLLSEINARKDWTGPRICIIRGVKRIDKEEERKYILSDYHLLPTSGHAGVRRMTNNIKRKFFWPGLDKDVREFVQKCSKCQKMKQGKYIKEPMEITTTAAHAFDKIYLDIVGPLQKDFEDNRYILTIQCELTKFVEAYPLKNKETESVAKELVDKFILRFGIPNAIATDRGTEFMSSVMQQVCQILEIEKLNSTAYHHQSIGALENAHKNLGTFLRIRCDGQKDTWSHWLPFWCYSFNNTVHTETKYTPFELVFGKPSRIPSRISDYIEPLYNPDSYPLDMKYRLQVAQQDARKNLIFSKYKRKNTYDKNVNHIEYKKGQLILIKNETGGKLDAKYDGPFIVLEDLGVNVKISRNNGVDVIHKNRTKVYVQ